MNPEDEIWISMRELANLGASRAKLRG